MSVWRGGRRPGEAGGQAQVARLGHQQCSKGWRPRSLSQHDAPSTASTAMQHRPKPQLASPAHRLCAAPRHVGPQLREPLPLSFPLGRHLLHHLPAWMGAQEKRWGWQVRGTKRRQGPGSEGQAVRARQHVHQQQAACRQRQQPAASQPAGTTWRTGSKADIAALLTAPT